MNLARIEIKVTTRSGTQRALFAMDNQGGQWAIIKGEFDTKKYEGCGTFKFDVAADRMSGSISCGNIVTVKAQKVGGAFVQYWKGKITKAPAPNTTRKVLSYEARGIWFDLEKGPKAVKYYDGADVDDAVLDLRADFDYPVTDVSNVTSEVSISSPYTIADIESEYDSFAELIQQLAVMQGGTVPVPYGVDQNGDFYFKDDSTAEVAHYWVGTHVADLSVENDINSLVNDVYVQSKEVVGGGLYTTHTSDATSISNYGTRTKVIQLRNTKSTEDAIQYKSAFLSQNKDPKQTVEASIPPFSEFIFPRGNVRITDTDGTEYSFPIQRVTYKLDGTSGLTGSMELGSQPKAKMDETFLEIIRKVERQSSNALSLTKIEHTKGEEFYQEAVVEARKAGFFNSYFAFLSDDNCIDKTKSTYSDQAFYRGEIIGPFPYLYNTIWSNLIPSGEQVDTVMLHTYTSENGRINFDSDEDFSYFFDHATDYQNWRVDENSHGAQQYANGAITSYTESAAGKGTPWRLPANHEWRMRFRLDTVNTGRPVIFTWGWLNTNNYNSVEIDMSDSTHIRVVIKKKIAGVVTTLDTLTATSAVGTMHELQALYGAVSTQYTVRLFASDGTTVQDTSVGLVVYPVAANTRMVFDNWYNATDGAAHTLVWFEPQQNTTPTRNTAYVSRNNGASLLSAGFLDDGRQHQVIDISGEPSGTDLRIAMLNRHPGRILGWGISW